MLSWLRTCIALWLLPLALLGGGDALRFRCAESNVVRSACCCPGALHSAPTDASLTQGCCCKVERQEANRAPATPPALERLAAIGLPAWSEQPAAHSWPAQSIQRIAAPVPAYEPRSRAGPSLIIAHRRLLI